MNAKNIQILSSLFSIVGSIIVGLLATKGIPKKYEIVRAPSWIGTIIGWACIALGFILNLISILLQ